MKEILVTGANGFVGKEITKLFNHTGTDVDRLDLAKASQRDLEQILSSYSAVVHCAAFTDTKKAQEFTNQEDQSPVYAINALVVRKLALACAHLGVHLIHISTDFVSNKQTPVLETDLPNIDNSHGHYAWTKAEGERLLRENGRNFSLVRISRPVKKGEGFYLKAQNYPAWSTAFKITPTNVTELVAAVAKIEKERMTGVFHVACSSPATPYDYLSEVAKKLGLEPKPASEQYDSKISRMGLSVAATENKLGFNFRSWQNQVNYITSK